MTKTNKTPRLLLAAAAVLATGAVVFVPAVAQESPATTRQAQPGQMAQGEMPTAEEVLKKYVEATGGEQAYRGMKSQTATGDFAMPDLGVTGGEFKVFQRAPDKLVTVVTIPGLGQIQQGVIGDLAYETGDVAPTRLLGPSERSALARSADPLAAVTPEKYYSSMEVAGVEPVDGKDAYRVVLTPKDGGEPGESYYDVETGLLVKSVETSDSPQGKVRAETTLSDYREVSSGGLTMKQPHKLVVGSPMGSYQITIKSIELNPEIPDSRFEAPAEVKQLAEQKKGDKAQGGGTGGM